jgi:hypothetical protein
MATSIKQLMETTNAPVPRITPVQAREMVANDHVVGRERGESDAGVERSPGRGRE